MIRAVEKIRERLRRTVAALEAAKIPYAVAGGNAVAPGFLASMKPPFATHRTWTSYYAAAICLQRRRP